jgi:hypothetical protein
MHATSTTHFTDRYYQSLNYESLFHLDVQNLYNRSTTEPLRKDRGGNGVSNVKCDA